jgi:hypothetical protein
MARGFLLDTNVADRILPVTAPIAERWALLNVPNPMPIIDGLLAATAIEHDLVLVTRNVADVQHSGAEVHNPAVGANVRFDGGVRPPNRSSHDHDVRQRPQSDDP